MPRTRRIVAPGLPHHIVLRGNNRRRICSFGSDYRRLVSLIARSARCEGCAVHGLCLMASHPHLIVTPPTETALSDFVRGFAQPYAQARNRARDGSGKLFDQRFFSKVIETDEHLAVCTAYVELNPVRAGIVADPEAYPWSTFRLHARAPRRSLVPASLLTPSGWYLGLARDPEGRADAYREFVVRVLREDLRPDALPPAPRRSGKRLLRPDGSAAA